MGTIISLITKLLLKKGVCVHRSHGNLVRALRILGEGVDPAGLEPRKHCFRNIDKMASAKNNTQILGVEYKPSCESADLFSQHR